MIWQDTRNYFNLKGIHQDNSEAKMWSTLKKISWPWWRMCALWIVEGIFCSWLLRPFDPWNSLTLNLLCWFLLFVDGTGILQSPSVCIWTYLPIVSSSICLMKLGESKFSAFVLVTFIFPWWIFPSLRCSDLITSTHGG